MALLTIGLASCGNESDFQSSKPSQVDSSTSAASTATTESKHTDSVQQPFEQLSDAILLKGKDDTYDIHECYETSNESLVSYEAEDTSLVSIDSNGIIKALKDEGSTSIRIKFQDNIYTIDVCVYDYLGVYGASKRVEAMNCDIKLQLDLKEDKTFGFYRGPMVIQALGEAIEEPEIQIDGTYAVKGAQIEFSFDKAYEDVGFYAFTLDFALDEDSGARLSGYIPTGGPMTDFILLSGVTVKDAE